MHWVLYQKALSRSRRTECGERSENAPDAAAEAGCGERRVVIGGRSKHNWLRHYILNLIKRPRVNGRMLRLRKLNNYLSDCLPRDLGQTRTDSEVLDASR